MTKKLPIYLKDQDGHLFHVKENASGERYVISGMFPNKPVYLLNIEKCPVGHVFEYSWALYADDAVERFTVIENLLYCAVCQ